MMKRIAHLAPDLEKTFERFWLAMFFSALATLFLIAFINRLAGPEGAGDMLGRLGTGLAVAAVLAVAGVLFSENQIAESFRQGRLSRFVRIVVPALAFLLFQVTDTFWVVSPMLVPVSLLLLSLSPVVGRGMPLGDARTQDRFWWINYRAISSAVIAGIGFALIALGLTAIERALALLFSLHAGNVIYNYLLPFTALFLTPLYWLTTLPAPTDYMPRELETSDFLSRAIGALAQYVITPFLFLYALILFVYGARILLTWSLPSGVLGWMVLGFCIVGAANWLLLHPAFTRANRLVRLFRAIWFWLPLFPLALFAVGVWVRISAYGLTPDRMGLVAGGIWALLLSLIFLTRRYADIRLVPGLAALVLVLFSIGPWNFINGPGMHQAMRLQGAIVQAQTSNGAATPAFQWTEQAARTARGAIDYLLNMPDDRQRLSAILKDTGVSVQQESLSRQEIFRALGLIDPQATPLAIVRYLSRTRHMPIDVSATPFSYGRVRIYTGGSKEMADLTFAIVEDELTMEGPGHVRAIIDLADWLDRQQGARIEAPELPFDYEGRSFLLLVENIRLASVPEESDRLRLREMTFDLFASAPPAANLPPVNLSN